jgi:hypothetical protein
MSKDKQSRKDLIKKLREGTTLYAIAADRIPGVCVELHDTEAIIVTKPQYNYNAKNPQMHLRLGDVTRSGTTK